MPFAYKVPYRHLRAWPSCCFRPSACIQDTLSSRALGRVRARAKESCIQAECAREKMYLKYDILIHLTRCISRMCEIGIYDQLSVNGSKRALATKSRMLYMTLKKKTLTFQPCFFRVRNRYLCQFNIVYNGFC